MSKVVSTIVIIVGIVATIIGVIAKGAAWYSKKRGMTHDYT